MGRSRKPRLRKKSSIRPLPSHAVTSLSGTSANSGTNSHAIAPKADSRRVIEKCVAPAASSGVK